MIVRFTVWLLRWRQRRRAITSEQFSEAIRQAQEALAKYPASKEVYELKEELDELDRTFGVAADSHQEP